MKTLRSTIVDGRRIYVEYVDENLRQISDKDWQDYEWQDITTFGDPPEIRKFVKINKRSERDR